MPEVLCKPCNERLGATVDASVARQFEAIRMMLAIEGDRGQTATVRARDQSGREVILEPGMQPRTAPRAPTILHQDDTGFTATFHSVEAAREFAEAMQRKHPDRRVVVSTATEHIEFPGPVTFGHSLGGPDLLRSAAKSTLALIASRALHDDAVFAQAWEYVDGGAEGPSGVSVGLAASPGPWTPEGLGSVSHRVAARSNVGRGFVEADVRYFGQIGVVIRIACPVAKPFAIAYGVDPISGAEAECNDWSGAIGIPEAADWDYVLRHYQTALDAIAARAKAREHEILSRRIAREALQRALEAYPNGEPRDLFSLLVARLCTEEIVRIRSRKGESVPAPEHVPRLQPRRR